MGAYSISHMTSLTDLIQQGSAHFWLFIPSALLLGALHGLEPGHSKTMMAAFIIAIRGTIFQAVLLGVSAAVSHSLVIWAIAAAGMHYGARWDAETTEPYFQLASGILILVTAIWIAWRTHRDIRLARQHAELAHRPGPQGGIVIQTGHGIVEITVFETDAPPRFRLFSYAEDLEPNPEAFSNAALSIETVRTDGASQVFSFARSGDYLESLEVIPEPHEFDIALSLRHGDHAHTFRTRLSEDGHHHGAVADDHGHSHNHDHDQASHHEHDHSHDHAAPASQNGEYQDAHEQAHAADIATRFAGRSVTNGQLILFGLTGGLMPCPAALTVLLLCLQLKRVALGFTLVLCFSIGLAVTLVSAGALAAWGVHHATKRFSGFGETARRLPYVSSGLLTALGIYLALQGWRHLG